MSWLANVYLFSLGVGGLYLLVAGALGAIGAAGGHGAGDAGHGAGGHDLDAGGHDFDAGGHSGDLPSADLDASADGGADHGEGFARGGTIATHTPEGASHGADISPFNLLNIMCLLASFGGTGLALLALNIPFLLTFPLALATGLLVTAGFHWLVANVLLKLQALAVPSQNDMLGLDAEVITPLDGEKFGEIAYILDGQRFTSPAKLVEGSYAGRQDPVTIIKVEGSTVYVEPRRRMLE